MTDESPKPFPHVSFSSLTTYESCPRQAHLKYVSKIPENPRPDTDAAERGTRLHLLAEKYVRGEIGLPEELKLSKTYLDFFREAYAQDPDTIALEQLWCFDPTWEPQPSYNDDTRVVAKLDLCQLTEGGLEACIVDWKSGKKLGKEVAHGDQITFYMLCALAKYEDLTSIQALLVYLDHGKDLTRTLTREEAMRYFPSYQQRIDRMMQDRDFYPKPSINHCRYCPYKQGKLGARKNAQEGTGHCDLNP